VLGPGLGLDRAVALDLGTGPCSPVPSDHWYAEVFRALAGHGRLPVASAMAEGPAREGPRDKRGAERVGGLPTILDI
jgi:hypothetical protein